jgi:hypothetical protein
MTKVAATWNLHLRLEVIHGGLLNNSTHRVEQFFPEERLREKVHCPIIE